MGAVRFTGALGVPETELRTQLRVRRGDRFDFYRWQQDRDELERFYADRGYLQAQVRAQRIEEADGSMTLNYEIARGPLSVLTIEGYDLPDDVVQAMRDSWNRAVFDGFLLDELRTLSGDHLGSRGFLQAEIDAEVSEEGEDKKEIVLRIIAGPQTSERRIEFRGNEQLTTTQLRDFIRRQGIDETVWADPTVLTRSLLALYQSEGMLEAEVALNSPEFHAGTATLPVEIAEGPVFTISSLSVVGAATRTDEAINALIGPQAGDIYSGLRMSDARARVDQDYRQAGFNQVPVSIRSTVDQVSDTVAVALEVEEGPRQVVQEIEVTGGDRTHSGLVSRALQLSPGQAVDLGEWNRARKRLYDTGAFRSVDIEAEPLDGVIEPVPGEQPVRARVQLEEWPAYRLRYGLQLKDEEAPLADRSTRELKPGVVGDLTRQNLFGRAITAGTAFRWDTDQRIIRGFGRTPSFFGLPIESNVFASRERENFVDLERFVEDITRLTLEQRIQPRQDLTIAYSYNLEWNNTFLEEPTPFFPDESSFQIARLRLAVIIDKRDDLFDATRGWFHSSNVEYGVEALGSDLRFIKYTGQQFHYWPLGNHLVATSAVRLGVGAGISGDSLSITERFKTGVGNTVRGYSQDSLGPVFEPFRPDPLNDPALFAVLTSGGNASLVLNQELRFPIFNMIRGVGFIDAGNIFPKIGDLSLRDLEVGVGVGVRADTPFGLFRFDFAIPLSETALGREVSDLLADPNVQIENDGKSRFFFSIGQVF